MYIRYIILNGQKCWTQLSFMHKSITILDSRLWSLGDKIVSHQSIFGFVSLVFFKKRVLFLEDLVAKTVLLRLSETLNGSVSTNTCILTDSQATKWIMSNRTNVIK